MSESASLLADHAIITEAQARIRERREIEQQRFEWKLATHLNAGGGIVERVGRRRTYWSLALSHCDALGAAQCAALIAEHYSRDNATLDFEAAP